VLRVSFQCELCASAVWQKPLDFLQLDVWPASLTDRFKTIVQGDLLQQWDSHWLCNPAATLSGFLSGLQHAVSVGLPSSTPVGQRSLLLGGSDTLLRMWNLRAQVFSLCTAWHLKSLRLCVHSLRGMMLAGHNA
jgi:hypothetical protein